MVEKKDIGYKRNTRIYQVFRYAAMRFNKLMIKNFRDFLDGKNVRIFDPISGQDLLQQGKRPPTTLIDARVDYANTVTKESMNRHFAKFMSGLEEAGILVPYGHGTYHVHLGNLIFAWADADKNEKINTIAHKHWLEVNRRSKWATLRRKARENGCIRN